MYKAFFSIYFLISISCWSQTLKEIPFKSSVSSFNDPGSGNPRVQCYIKFDTIQFASDAGLKFSIRLKNISADSVVIKNPIDFININLFDSIGKDRFIPYVSKVYLRDPRSFQGYSFFFGQPMVNGELTGDKLSDI